MSFKRRSVVTAWSLFALFALTVPACLEIFPEGTGDCRERLVSCPGDGGDAGTGGTATGGAPTAGAAAVGGDAGGSAGAAGQAGASAEGGGGGGGSEPCDGACGGATPICDDTTDTCVECLAKSDCGNPRPVCDLESFHCVECVANGDCGSTASKCDPDAHLCVECLENSHCANADASRCSDGICQACSGNSDCSHLAGTGVCDGGECVECTGKDFAACGAEQGTPLVCDSLLRTCTANRQRTAGLCQPCVSDAHCRAGQLCVLEQFGTPARDVGYFCFWKRGDTANGAPALCSSARPYIRTVQAASSIDGEAAEICGLRVSTCVAKNEFSTKDCTNSGAPDNSRCGFAPPNDATCAPFDVGVYRCTMRCLSSDDCLDPSICDTGASPQICGL